MPVENLMTPDTVRRALWDPPADLDARLAELRAPRLADRPRRPGAARRRCQETDASRRAREAPSSAATGRGVRGFTPARVTLQVTDE